MGLPLPPPARLPYILEKLREISSLRLRFPCINVSSRVSAAAIPSWEVHGVSREKEEQRRRRDFVIPGATSIHSSCRSFCCYLLPFLTVVHIWRLSSLLLLLQQRQRGTSQHLPPRRTSSSCLTSLTSHVSREIIYTRSWRCQFCSVKAKEGGGA